VFDLEKYSIEVSLAFYLPTNKLHISLRIGERLRSFGLGEVSNTLRGLSVPSKELRQVFFQKSWKPPGSLG
jgi:hypothetical protein